MERVVVDTSVFIDYFNGNNNRESDILDELILNREIVLGDIVAMEVFQGFRSEKQRKIAFELFEPLQKKEILGFNNCFRYGEFYAILRSKGITIRKSNDVVIAGYCILNNLPLLQRDRDFEPFQEHLGLELL